MEKSQIITKISELKASSKKRNFNQTLDLIVNLKDFNLKTEKLETYVQLPYDLGKKIKICAFVDSELITSARENCDKIITKDEFSEWKNPKLVSKLAKEYDIFISQANLMKDVAMIFGRVLGPLGKMPNPKFGAVILPKDNLKQTVEKFRKSVKLVVGKEAILKIPIGKENSSEEHVAENIRIIIETLEHTLSKGKHNIKNILIKFTMSNPIILFAHSKKEEAEEKE